MEVKYYQIAGVRLCILSQFDTLDSDVTRPFLAPAGPPDVTCRIYSVDQLPCPKGVLCQEETLMEVHREGDRVYRGLMKRGKTDYRYMLSKIVPGQDIVLWALESELSWSNQMGYIFLALGLGTLLQARGRLVLHASVVETEQGAVLFSAASGTGKSTQAALWEKHMGAKIINGDRCAVGIQDGQPMVYGVPMAGTSGISVNQTLPLRAMVALGQAKKNEIRQLRGGEAILKIGFCSVIDRWSQESRSQALDMLSRLMETVPVFSLQCLPNREAVELLANTLEAIS